MPRYPPSSVSAADPTSGVPAIFGVRQCIDPASESVAGQSAGQTEFRGFAQGSPPSRTQRNAGRLQRGMGR